MDVPEISFETWVRDLEAVVEAEGLDEPFPLLGISQGAAVAVAQAARVSGLVLYGGCARGRLERDPTPRAKRTAEALENLLVLGWDRNNEAFREVFARIFMPDATPAQLEWLAELQEVSTDAENALRIERTSYGPRAEGGPGAGGGDGVAAAG